MYQNDIPRQTSSSPAPPQIQLRQARLILADDNPAILRQVSAILEEDFDILAALPDGESALRKAVELKPDLLVLDISMGRMSGFDVARALKQAGQHPRLVFVTIHQESDFVKAAMACGASGYVIKSHLASDLIPAVNAALLGELFLSPCLLKPENMS